MISFGRQTITVQRVTPGTRDPQLGVRTPTIATYSVPGCRLRPWQVTEKTDQGVVVKEYKATMPPTTEALDTTEADRLICDGETYLITGVLKKPHPSGGIHHVTILCRQEVG